jgi:hypothetical protein
MKNLMNLKESFIQQLQIQMSRNPLQNKQRWQGHTRENEKTSGAVVSHVVLIFVNNEGPFGSMFCRYPED